MAWRAEGGMERMTVPAASADSSASVAESALASATPSSPPLRPTSAADVREIVRDAIAHKTALRIVGRGTWLGAGRPVGATRRVSLDGLTGIADYTPGDLTLTARAGTTLAEIARATVEHGQWLALAPWGGDAGSLGATVATATAGPMSGSLGTPRDVVIGLEVVAGSGEVVRGGGRVVKNVAGFDLTRLMVGAWGTLGILTEVSVRLRGLPEREATLALAVPNAPAPLADFLTRLRAAPIAPIALEMLSARLAAQLGLGQSAVVIARLAGNADAVAAQRAAIGALGEVAEVAGDVWTAVRNADPTAATVVRFSSPVARFPEIWLAAGRLAAAGDGHVHASVLRSSARVVLPHNEDTLSDAALDLLRSGNRDTRIFERLPAALWPVLAPSRVNDRLSGGVRAAFDPHRLLNPGILGETQA
jgi:glycolate oxidase FAD binding subunit